MKHPEQHQQIQLTAQAQTAYSGMRETSMAEPQVEQPKPNRFRRVIHKLRRRKPQPIQRVSEAEEEEKRREQEAAAIAATTVTEAEQSLQRQAVEVSRRAASARSEVNSRVSSEESNMEERGGRVVTLHSSGGQLPELPTTGISNPRLREILDLYNDQRQRHLPESSENLKTLHKQISDVLVDPNTAATPSEIAYVRTEVLRALRAALVEQQVNEVTYETEQKAQKQKDLQAQIEANKRSNERYDYLNERVLNTGDEEAEREDVIAERATRDRAFNAIFASADAQANVRFDSAFDIFTDGVKYRTFLNDLLSASVSPKNITDREAQKFIDYKRRVGEDVPESLSAAKISLQMELREDLTRYQVERQVRETLHNANFVLELPNIKAEDIYGFIDSFSSELVDHVFKMPGVRDMMNIYENQLRFAMYEHDGYLRPQDVKRYSESKVTGEGDDSHHRTKVVAPSVEVRTKELFRKYMKENGISVRDDKTGRMYIRKAADITDSEIERIFTTARGMLVLSQRMLSIAAESKIPPNGQYTSLYMQDAIQNYNPYVHLMAKYGVPNWKVLSMLLTEPDREKVLGIRKPWFTKQMEHLEHLATDEKVGSENIRAILDGEHGEKLQLRRQNPGFCGDAFGFLSWRVGQDPAKISGAGWFLDRGQKLMRVMSGEIVDPDDRIQVSNQVQRVFNSLNNDQKARYQNEYSNWIGTGLRLERNRRPNQDSGSGEVMESKKVLFSIARLQPGRMFLKSYKMQKRLKGEVDAWYRSAPVDHNDPKMTSAKVLLQVQNNLLFLESKMYQMRDVLLREGYTFDGVENKHDASGKLIPELADVIGKEITLEVVMERLQVSGEGLPHPELMDATFKFRDLVLNDFKKNKDATGHWEDPSAHHDAHGDAHGGHHGKKFRSELEGQYQEFIYNREYNHGYTLWSGDAPVDEFDMSATGPTGAFIRRARENKDVGEANGLIIGLLQDLKYIRTPDQAFKHLTEIYGKIQSYDASMAKETVTYLTEGILKFYGSTGLSNTPILGMIVDNYPGLIPALYKAPYTIPNKIITFLPKGVLKTMRIFGANEAVDKWDKKVKDVKDKFKGLPGVESAMGLDQYFTGSFAQRFYGKQAPVWKAYERHYMIQRLLLEHGYITPEQGKYLKDVSTSRPKDVVAHMTSFFGPFIAMAVVLYLIKEGAEEV